MEISFNPDELAQIDKVKSKYPSQQSAIMDVLWLAQKKWGWISPEIIEYIARLLDLPASSVEGVVSFYTMYFKHPMGKYHIQVCTNISCMLLGGENIYEYIKDKLGIDNHQTTNDGKFSLEEVECMGACGESPMIAINEDYYYNMNKEKIDKLLAELS
ncbi:NADH-quinone oxidoreductase subunit NuoE [bacterium]|nr:NADH-quinone oxidoreductase subunit NuoE [bacterium]